MKNNNRTGMNPIENQHISWTCRFHPIDYFHEVGCPHQAWTVEQLQGALETAKKVNSYHLEILKDHLEVLK